MSKNFMAAPSNLEFFRAENWVYVRDMDLRDPETLADRYGNGNLEVAGIGPYATEEEAVAAAKTAYLGPAEDGECATWDVWAYFTDDE